MHGGIQHAPLAVHAANQSFTQQVHGNIHLLFVAQFTALAYRRQLLADHNKVWMRTRVNQRGVLCAKRRSEGGNVGWRCFGIKHQAREQFRGK